jgi:hypothetical protein
VPRAADGTKLALDLAQFVSNAGRKFELEFGCSFKHLAVQLGDERLERFDTVAGDGASTAHTAQGIRT